MMLSRLSSPRYVPARNQYPQTGKPQLFHKQFSCWAYCGSKIHLSSCTRSHCHCAQPGRGRILFQCPIIGTWENACSGFRTTAEISAVQPFPLFSSTATVPKNPLRLIVARTPIFHELYNDGTLKLTYFF